MRARRFILIFVMFALCSLCLYANDLDEMYRRNGEVYLLIGDGPRQGVYRLNNPSNTPNLTVSNTTPLYDPKTSYGISVNIERQVFTFSETVANGFHLLPGDILVKMKRPGDTILQGQHADWRDASFPGNSGETSRPVYTTSGRDGRLSWGRAPYRTISINNKGEGKIPNGSWYQSIDRDTARRPGKVYRDKIEAKDHNYDLLRWKQGIRNNQPKNLGLCAQSYEKRIDRQLLGSCIDPCGTANTNFTADAQPQYVSISLSSFGRCYCYTRTKSSADAKLTISQGNLTGDLTNYKGKIIGANKINDLTTQWAGCSLRNKDSDYVYVLGSAIIKSWIKDMGFNVPSKFDVTAVSVSDQWYLEGGIVYAFDESEGKAYQFTRKENQADGSEGSTSYYRAIDLSAISRDEKIDDIKSDGFGDMYFATTIRTPKDANSFTPSDACNVKWTAVSNDVDYVCGWVVYDQKVSKGVYTIPLNTNIYDVVDKVYLGSDKYKRSFRVNKELAEGSLYPNRTASYIDIDETNFMRVANAAGCGWVWIDDKPVMIDPDHTVASPKHVELGVINVATPPNPGNASSVLDIVGPLKFVATAGGGGSFEPVTGAYSDVLADVTQGYYEFRAENQPVWHGRDDQNSNGEKNATDENGNGTKGFFAATASKSGNYSDPSKSDHVLYRWQIYQIEDAYGKTIKPPLIYADSNGYKENYSISHYFAAGVYQIVCWAKFKYYNYSKLPYGSTVLNKPECLSAFLPARGIGFNDPNITEDNFKGIKPLSELVDPDPLHPKCTVRMLKVNIQRNASDTGLISDIMAKFPGDTEFKSPDKSGQIAYHCVEEKDDMAWRLGEINALCLLPDITDPNMVPGSLQWCDDFAEFTWQYQVNDMPTCPDGVYVETLDSYTVKAPNLGKRTISDLNALNPVESQQLKGFANDAATRFAVPFPTDPKLGDLTCKATRKWCYTYRIYDDDGFPMGEGMQYGIVTYTGEVKLLVRDVTPPEIIAINGRTLNGKGERLCKDSYIFDKAAWSSSNSEHGQEFIRQKKEYEYKKLHDENFRKQHPDEFEEFLTKTYTDTYRGYKEKLENDVYNDKDLFLRLIGQSGETLAASHNAYPKERHDTIIEVTVQDNNPFGNQTGGCELQNPHPEQELSYFKPENQFATLQYETSSSKYFVPRYTLSSFVPSRSFLKNQDCSLEPISVREIINKVLSNQSVKAQTINENTGKANAAVEVEAENVNLSLYYSSANNLVNDKLRLVRTPVRPQDLPAGSTFSRVKYSIPLEDLVHFGRDLNEKREHIYEYPSKLPIDFANNHSNYEGVGQCSVKHKGYGLMFSARDASGYEANPQYLGNIETTDTLAPYLYVKILDTRAKGLAKDATSQVPPYDELYAAASGSCDIYNLFNPACSDWKPTLLSGQNSASDVCQFNFGSAFRKPTATNFANFNIEAVPPPQLSEDDKDKLGDLDKLCPALIDSGVEVIFTLICADNIDIASETARFRAEGPDKDSLFFRVDTRQISIKPQGPVVKARALLRAPGLYKVYAEVYDTAKTLSDQPSRNKRTLEFGLLVAPTTMDIRVIDKSVTKRVDSPNNQ